MRRDTAAVGRPLLWALALGAVAAVALAPSAPAGVTAQLEARPNPVPALGGAGTTTVTWRADDRAAYVTVAEGDGGQRRIWTGASGVRRVPWIETSVRYVFRLYSEDGELLAAERVRTSYAARPAFGFDEAQPSPGEVGRALARPEIRVAIVGALVAALVLAVTFLRRRRRPARMVARAVAVAATAFAVFVVLAAPTKPFAEQPFPDSWEYGDSARRLADGDGYVTRVHYGEEQPPRYPPGYPVLLAPFAAFGSFPGNVELGAKVLAASYAVAVAAAAWILAGPVAAAVAVGLVGASPFARESGTFVLADAVSAGLAALALAAAARPTRRRTALAGLLAGALVLVRLPLAVVPLALLIALPRERRLRFLAFSAPAAVVLLAYQALAFGSPLETGYAYYVGGSTYSLAHVTEVPGKEGPWIFPDALEGGLLGWICPCEVGGPMASLSSPLFYGALLLGAFWVFVPPFAAVPGLVLALRSRGDVFARATLLTVVLTLVVLLPYWYQAARLFAAPVTLMIVLTGVAAARLLERRAGPRDG